MKEGMGVRFTESFKLHVVEKVESGRMEEKEIELLRLENENKELKQELEKRRDHSQAGDEIVLMYVRTIRGRQPRMGTRKMYWLFKAVIKENDIKMGRDKFLGLLRAHGLLVKSRAPTYRRKRDVRIYHW